MSQNLKYKTTVTPSDGGKQIVEVECLEVIVEKKWYHTFFGPSPTYVKDSALVVFSLIMALTNLPGLFDALIDVIGDLFTTFLILVIFMCILVSIIGISLLATAQNTAKNVKFVIFTKLEITASLLLTITTIILLLAVSYIVYLKLFYLFYNS